MVVDFGVVVVGVAAAAGVGTVVVVGFAAVFAPGVLLCAVGAAEVAVCTRALAGIENCGGGALSRVVEVVLTAALAAAGARSSMSEHAIERPRETCARKDIDLNARRGRQLCS
jgi:hypothetical protein